MPSLSPYFSAVTMDQDGFHTDLPEQGIKGLLVTFETINITLALKAQ